MSNLGIHYNEIRKPDCQYRNCLKEILERGRYTRNSYQERGRYTFLSLPPMTFDLSNGFPIITERDLGKFWWVPIGELLAFMNGARTLDRLEEFGCRWWDKWATAEKCAQFGLEPGDLGEGSYGPGFNYKLGDNSTFNQFFHLIEQIKFNPYLATHKISPWHPHLCLQHNNLQRKVVVAPCHGDIQVTILENDLYLRMDQRSGDFPIGVPANMIQYAALTLMMAHVLSYRPHEYIHSVHDAHIYEDQIESVMEMVGRNPKIFPTVHITDEGKKIKNIFDFRPHHFEISDYHPHPAIKIPTTI